MILAVLLILMFASFGVGWIGRGILSDEVTHLARLSGWSLFFLGWGIVVVWGWI